MRDQTENERAAENAKALYTAKAALYHFVFVHLIGYGYALRALFQKLDLLTPGTRILDAGCGGGLLTKIHHRIARKRAIAGVRFYAFDLTPRMLDRFAIWIEKNRARDQIELCELNVLKLEERPTEWNEFDVIVTASMLEYIPRASLPDALEGLIGLLKPGGRLVLCITRQDILTRWFVGTWWQANLYTQDEVRDAFHRAGAKSICFHKLPGIFRVLMNSVIVAEYHKTATLPKIDSPLP